MFLDLLVWMISDIIPVGISAIIEIITEILVIVANSLKERCNTFRK